MKTLNNYIVPGALYTADTGPEAAVGDQVKLYLDTEANSDFPEFIIGVIQHPVVKVQCNSATSYSIEYDEDDLDGAVTLLHSQDIIDATIVLQAEVISLALEALTATVASLTTVVSGKANKTGGNNFEDLQEFGEGFTCGGPITYNSGTTFTYDTGVAALQRTALGAATSASPTFTGTVTLGDAVNVVVNATTGTKIGTSVSQKLAFHNSTPVVQRAGAAQAAVTATVGAAVVTTASALTSYGYTQTQADNLVLRVNALIVDTAANTALLNELRAALVEKGIIKGAA